MKPNVELLLLVDNLSSKAGSHDNIYMEMVRKHLNPYQVNAFMTKNYGLTGYPAIFNVRFPFGYQSWCPA